MHLRRLILQAAYAGEKRHKGEQGKRKRRVLKRDQERVSSTERAKKEKSQPGRAGTLGVVEAYAMGATCLIAIVKWVDWFRASENRLPAR